MEIIKRSIRTPGVNVIKTRKNFWPLVTNAINVLQAGIY